MSYLQRNERNTNNRVPLRYLLPLFAVFALGGCGGSGGGSASVPPSVPPLPTVVFTARETSTGPVELYIVDAAEAIRKLSGAMVAGGNVQRIQVSPDRQWVAYIADQDMDTLNELYAAPIAGGPAVKLNPPLPPDTGIVNFAWAPDSSRIAYTGDQTTNDVFELYTVRPDGSGNTTVSGPLVAGGNVRVDAFAWAPDGSRIAYVADQTTNGVDELYTVAPDGTGNFKASGDQVAGGDVGANTLGPVVLKWAPDSSRIAYIADQDTNGVNELYASVPTAPLNNVRVSADLVAGGGVGWAYEWSPDSSRIAYIADQNTDTVDELYLADARAAVPTIKLSGALTVGGGVASFYWAPDGSRVAYRADQETDGISELYTVRIDGTNNLKVSGVLVAGGRVGFRIAWAPDSSRIAYVADQDIDEVSELYVANPEVAASAIKVSGTLPAGGNVGGDPFDFNAPAPFAWAPNGARLAYAAQQEIDNTIDLYGVASDGSNPVKLSGTLGVNGDVYAYSWSSDGAYVVYQANQTASTLELYRSRSDGTDNRKLSDALLVGSSGPFPSAAMVVF